MIFFKKKRIELGDGHILQYTIFESKKIGGIWLYNWKTIKQNRFHTHAFASYAITLNGSYVQEVVKNGEIVREVVSKRFIPRYLPKYYCHRILKAEPNTWTMVLFGKWDRTWCEYFPDTSTWVVYKWGRLIVSKIKGHITDPPTIYNKSSK